MALFVDICVVLASAALGFYALSDNLWDSKEKGHKKGLWDGTQNRFYRRITWRGYYVLIGSLVAVVGGGYQAWDNQAARTASAQNLKKLTNTISNQSAKISTLQSGQKQTHKEQDQENRKIALLIMYHNGVTKKFNGRPVTIDWKNPGHLGGKLVILKTKCPLKVKLHYELVTAPLPDKLPTDPFKILPTKNDQDVLVRKNSSSKKTTAHVGLIPTIEQLLGVKIQHRASKPTGDIKLTYRGSPDFKPESEITSLDVMIDLFLNGINPWWNMGFRQLAFEVTPVRTSESSDCTSFTYYAESGT